MTMLAPKAPKLDVLQNVRIASPCPANWQGMVGDDRVRHCGECNLNVYNFSAMTRPEVEALLRKREGRVFLAWNAAIIKHQRMQVAVAGMENVGDAQAVFRA